MAPLDVLQPRPLTVYVFCDGTVRGRPPRMGIGVLLRHGRAEKLLSEPIGEGTANLAELVAIERGLSQVRRRDLPVVIVSDSAYAVTALSGQRHVHEHVDVVQRIANLIGQFQDIRFRHLPAGSADPDNTEVTGLAERAAADGLVTDELRAQAVPEPPEEDDA